MLPRRECLSLLGLPKHALVLVHSHPLQLVRPIILVQDIIRILAQLLHVRANEHLAQLDEIAVLLIVDFNHAPRVGATPDLAAVRGVDRGCAADYGKGDFGLDGQWGVRSAVWVASKSKVAALMCGRRVSFSR